MIDQSNIPPIKPGEAITADLMNQLARRADGGRVTTGDGTANVQMIGSTIGIGAKLPNVNSDRDILVMIRKPLPASSKIPALAPAMYYGSLYLQPGISLSTTKTTTTLDRPMPNAISCVVFNLAENGLAGHAITVDTYAIARFIGWTFTPRGKTQIPLLATRIDAGAIVSGFVTGNAAGNGKYVGKSFISIPTTDVSASGSLATADMGTLASAADCLILNMVEADGVTTTGHDVTAAANTSQFAIYFLGQLQQVNSDGTKVIRALLIYAACTAVTS